MNTFSYSTRNAQPSQLGMVVLQSDETLEDDMRSVLPDTVSLLVTRVPSDTTVTLDTLGAMEQHLASAADLFPQNKQFDVLGYGCTSGTAQIGSDTVAACLRSVRGARHVTNPLSALIAACTAAKIKRLALLSPYIAPVSKTLRDVLQTNGIETPVFATFGEANEAAVARIDGASVVNAATTMMQGQTADALFLSCTNLHSFDVIPELEDRLGIPVLSSNLVLCWHMLQLAGAISSTMPPASVLGNATPNTVLSMSGGSR